MNSYKKKHTIQPKKGLSQSFLQSRGTAKKIVDALCISDEDTVLEVGPGTGILTEFLIEKAKKVIVVEKDERLVRVIKEKFKNTKNIVIREGDILKQDIKGLSEGKRLKLISNLPYSISKQFLYLLLENRAYFSCAVLTLQREVAQRMAGQLDKKSYGTLSIMYHCFSDTEILFPIPPSFFYPRPKVSSLVVRIEFLDTPRYPIDDYNSFFSFVKTCFTSRRKMLRKTLGLPGPLGEKRPEDLTPEEFVRIWRARYKTQELNS
ncbi:MAG: 16S rRNA (adenine(1518)-N(6)/adenine(1519)-N(6))-dimethyltransferase RsmA [bacterium]|nr:16S rRNA (adenine(1518)-N(6)/adenine(1519)-N(6))-dimethyltransferase RsmA [bacterium]